jgi:hypothetical protein
MINKKSLLLLFICVAVPHQLQAAGMDSPRIKALSSRRNSLAGTSELVPANVAAAHIAAGLPPAPAAGAAAGAPAAPTFDLAAFAAGRARGRALGAAMLARLERKKQIIFLYSIQTSLY